jgi:serine/threonine protein kinase
LVSRNEEVVKLGDISFVKDVNSIIKSNKLLGTLNYLSPEIIKEDPNYSQKIDLW